MDEKLKVLLTRVFCLYNKFGIKSVTMDDVSRELGISKKTLYNHVSDKSELVEKAMIVNSIRHQQALALIVKDNLNAIEELLAVNKYMNMMMKEQNPSLNYDLSKYYPEIYSRLVAESKKRMFDAIRKNLIKGKNEGLYRQSIDVDIISKIHLTRLEQKYSTDSFTISELSSEKVMKEIFDYHLHGIASERGLILLKKITSNK